MVKQFRKSEEMKENKLENCHGGEGTLICKTVLNRDDCLAKLYFIQDNLVPPGTTVPAHEVPANCEGICYLVEGELVMLIDEEKHLMKNGDCSVVDEGHKHGFLNKSNKNARVIVFLLEKRSSSNDD